ncbi:MAG: aminotransferase class V-fold PLP-dependent enzyme, partial [Gammaproteobacteria bacterium]|nr:aminotransferase class V-fold PLP-dependent enzyme [Gemmatimonadota bacterium]NIU78002.1 aminotransferase class V-fold PLP-dependent enzyme [Gammaproteobacteria bacterium]
ADASEVALVHCTKEGEQIVLDSLVSLLGGGSLVTNDLHFAGSLHNLLGLRDAGMDVRIVRSRGFEVDLEQMADQIDDRTALVSVTLVSNVNGRVEPMKEL